jgi:hypothetical protein
VKRLAPASPVLPALPFTIVSCLSATKRCDSPKLVRVAASPTSRTSRDRSPRPDRGGGGTIHFRDAASHPGRGNEIPGYADSGDPIDHHGRDLDRASRGAHNAVHNDVGRGLDPDRGRDPSLERPMPFPSTRL